MRPPCEYVQIEYLPQLRARIIRELIEKYNWSISRIAKALQISITAATRYKKVLNQKTRISSEILDKIAMELARDIADDSLTPETFIEKVCHYCMNMRVEGEICKLHRESITSLIGCTACSRVFIMMGGGSAERVSVISELNNALSQLSLEEKFINLVPEVRTNLVMAVRDAKGPEDIAAFPGRLTVIKGKIVALKPPEFNASKHMANVLLSMMRKSREVRAAICIKKITKLTEVLDNCKFKYAIVDRNKYGSISEFIRDLEFFVDVIIDPGGLGIEPVAYIFGRSAIDVVNKVKKLLHNI